MRRRRTPIDERTKTSRGDYVYCAIFVEVDRKNIRAYATMGINQVRNEFGTTGCLRVSHRLVPVQNRCVAGIRIEVRIDSNKFQVHRVTPTRSKSQTKKDEWADLVSDKERHPYILMNVPI